MPEDEIALPRIVDEEDLRTIRLLNEQARINQAEQDKLEKARVALRKKLKLAPGAVISPEVAHKYQLDIEEDRLANAQTAQVADAAAATAAIKEKYSLDDNHTYDLKTGRITRS